jgi:hypothetical protein
MSTRTASKPSVERAVSATRRTARSLGRGVQAELGRAIAQAQAHPARSALIGAALGAGLLAAIGIVMHRRRA